MVGCARPDTTVAKAPVKDDAPALGVPCEAKQTDNFDKAADLSRLVWDDSKKAWRYLSSDEMVAKYGKAWDYAKNVAGDMTDSVRAAYLKWEADRAQYAKDHSASK
ncbi:MAG: hypothetical protein KGH64_04350 [Candidatus Micrarchaeota archaeon]|nr:hypothetical protein [Candidatus Micrarchaeota archaeon]